MSYNTSLENGGNMILDLNNVKEESNKSLGDLDSSFSPKDYLPSNNKQIIKVILFTRQELKLYPNGQTYVSKTQSWIQGAKYESKPKKKKSIKEIKVVKKSKIEEY